MRKRVFTISDMPVNDADHVHTSDRAADVPDVPKSSAFLLNQTLQRVSVEVDMLRNRASEHLLQQDHRVARCTEALASMQEFGKRLDALLGVIPSA